MRKKFADVFHQPFVGEMFGLFFQVCSWFRVTQCMLLNIQSEFLMHFFFIRAVFFSFTARYSYLAVGISTNWRPYSVVCLVCLVSCLSAGLGKEKKWRSLCYELGNRPWAGIWPATSARLPLKPPGDACPRPRRTARLPQSVRNSLRTARQAITVR